MQRSRTLALLAALAAIAAVGVFAWNEWGSAPPPAPVPVAGGGPEDPDGAAGLLGAQAAEVETDAGHRRSVLPASFGGSRETDPEVRAALTGFRGRVVDHNNVPVPDCGVRIYRFAVDALMVEDMDFWAEASTFEPQYIAGETRTSDDGSFLISGVWPQAFYLMFAGLDTDAPSHRVLPHAPKPGEILDLGDVVLNHAGVISGTVVDEDGEPVPDALVRAVDLPGQIIGFMPVERFDPEGCVLIREPQSPVQVVEMPQWVARAYEHLPIPTTRSGEDGAFRLVGVVPGNNVLAITKPQMLSLIKPTVRVVAGEEKAVGRLRMRSGEELYGAVVDSLGEPIAGAEVVAGSMIPAVPFDFASRVGTTDEDGQFEGLGFGPGKVSVAARRGPRDPWVLAEPQSILGDVVVTLPARGALTVYVQDSEGVQIPEPKLRLLACSDEEAMVMNQLGFLPSVDLSERLAPTEDGGVRIKDLDLGSYVVLASADGQAMASVEVDLKIAAAEARLQLRAGIEHRVRVLTLDDKPIVAAKVFVQERGPNELREMPFCAGRTDKQGRIAITEAGTERVRVSVSHPRWGTVHGEKENTDGELVLRVQEPGWIDGLITEYGKAPAPGRFTVAAEWSPDQRGPAETVPTLSTPDLEGRFRMHALQPGEYHLGVINSLETLKSPGGVLALAQSMWMQGSDMPTDNVIVRPGEGSEVRLEVGKDEYTGPTGNVFGMVQINGVLAEGAIVQARTENGRIMKETDKAGRFDLGAVPVGSVRITILDNDSSTVVFDRQELWESRFELGEAEQKELSIEVRTTRLEGMVLRPGGSPAAGVRVRLSGRALTEGGETGDMTERAQTDSSGRFTFERMPEGIYELSVMGRGDDAVRGELRDVRATNTQPAIGLRLQLRQATSVVGRVDERAFSTKPDWGWVQFRVPNPDAPDDPERGQEAAGFGFDKELRFRTHELDPGTYFVRVSARVDGDWQVLYEPNPVIVPAGGLQDLVLYPQSREGR